MIKLVESQVLPKEGFFWIIDGKIISYDVDVPKYNYEYQLDGKTHKNTWENIKPNGCDKEFDYYPRGRVMVDPNYDFNNEFQGYLVTIFLDDCITAKEYKEMVLDYYNLNLPTVISINWMDNLRKRTGIDHYRCNNCKNKD